MSGGGVPLLDWSRFCDGQAREPRSERKAWVELCARLRVPLSNPHLPPRITSWAPHAAACDCVDCEGRPGAST